MKLYINGCSYASGFAAEDTNEYTQESAWTYRIADRLNAENLILECSPAKSIWYTCETIQNFVKSYTGDKSDLKIIGELSSPAYANLPVIKSISGVPFKPSHFVMQEDFFQHKLVFQSLSPEKQFETGDENLFRNADIVNLHKIVRNHVEEYAKNQYIFSISAYKVIYETAELLREHDIDFVFVWIMNNKYTQKAVISNKFPLQFEKFKNNIISPDEMCLYNISRSVGLINAFNHPNKEGHKIIAKTLCDYIKKHKIFRI